MTDVEKVLLIHDYMCINLMYGENNTDVPEYHNIMGYVLEGKAVCEGYAKIFQYYMNKLEIPSRIMLGNVEEGYHAWTEVEKKAVVKTAVVGAGPIIKRFRPKARGSAGRIRKRTSHLEIVLSEI